MYPSHSFLENERHDNSFAGLLTYSGWLTFPSAGRQTVVSDIQAILSLEITAAGLSGIFTRFPFHPQPVGRHIGTKPHKYNAKRMNFKAKTEFLAFNSPGYSTSVKTSARVFRRMNSFTYPTEEVLQHQ